MPRHTSFSSAPPKFPPSPDLSSLTFDFFLLDTLANFRPLLAYANARPASVSHLANREISFESVHLDT